MSDPVLDLDQRLRAPLAAFDGAPPPAPAWFRDAIARAPERSFTEVEGACIETLTWGERGSPGLLLLHGGMAHADWYDHIAPFFAGDWRVAAMSMSGMGRSDWREHYEVGQLAREMAAVARAAGLYDAGPPVFVGHSLGSRPVIHAAADPSLAPGVAIILDAAISPPDAPDMDAPAQRPLRVYSRFETAVARFRLMPYQACDNLFVLDHIARHSLAEVTSEDGEPGWTWRFDPAYMGKLRGVERARTDAAFRAALCPMALVYGDRSAIVRPDNLAYTRSIAPVGTLFEPVADAAHHLFLDQPQGTVAALKDVLAAFGR